jgi:hypothetical protein
MEENKFGFVEKIRKLREDVAIHTIEIEKKETEEKTLKYLELLKELL